MVNILILLSRNVKNAMNIVKPAKEIQNMIVYHAIQQRDITKEKLDLV